MPVTQAHHRQGGAGRYDVASPWLLLCLLAVAAVMDSVNSTIFVLTRGQIMGGLHAIPDEAAWINMAYVGAKLTAFPLSAWIATRMASRRLIPAAIGVLICSSLGCAATGELAVLIAWRIVQGASGALLLVCSQTLLFERLPRSRQGLAQGLFAFAIILAPTTVAPAVQGWTVDALSWPWIFWVNIPLGLVGLLTVLVLPRGEVRGPAGRLDWIGLALFGVAMTAMVFLTQEGSRYNWLDETEIVECGLLAIAALILFVAWQIFMQKRGALIDFAVFRDQHFSFGFAVSFVAGAALFGSAFIIPAFALQVLALSPTYAGLLLLPSGLFIGLGLLAAGMAIQWRNLDPGLPIPLGIACFMTSMWMLSGSISESGLPDMMPALLLRGLGLGLLFVSLTLLTLRDLPGALLAQGIALFNIGRQLGGQFGIAMLTTYLEHQNALNRTVLSQYLTSGNAALTDRLEILTALLSARGYSVDEAGMAATPIIRDALMQQAMTLSFNECFLAVALLFVVAAPLLVGLKVILHHALPDHAAVKP